MTPSAVVSLLAPAKLTLSLRVVGVRSDGYHLLDAEMVSVSLCDELRIDVGGAGVTVGHDDGDRPGASGRPRGGRARHCAAGRRGST